VFIACCQKLQPDGKMLFPTSVGRHAFRISCSSALLLIVLVFARATPLVAQTKLGAVSGVVTLEGARDPIPFALVRLLPVDSQVASGRQGLTNSQGRFHFASVPVGSYHLQLLRIGYRPVLSPVIEVRAGDTLEQDLHGSTLGIPLPAMIVYGEDACLGAERVASDPYLTALWDDVRKGVEIRRAFELRYRYNRSLGQTTETLVPSRPAVRRVRADTTVSEPDSVLIREERTRARRIAEGFGKGNSLILPDEKELLDDAFLREHCIVPVPTEAEGATGVRFRQSAKRRDGFGIQGTIWVDNTTRLMRRLELEYLNGDKPFSEATVEYANVAVVGTVLRLPTTGVVALRPLQAPRGTTVSGTISFSYWGFEEVRPK